MRLQTCRRHPAAGRFFRTCPGCTQELHDIEQRNRAAVPAFPCPTCHVPNPTQDALDFHVEAAH